MFRSSPPQQGGGAVLQSPIPAAALSPRMPHGRPGVSPTQAWCHFFRTVRRRCGMDPRSWTRSWVYVQAKTDDHYGGLPLDTVMPEIDKDPRYVVTAAETTDRRRIHLS